LVNFYQKFFRGVIAVRFWGGLIENLIGNFQVGARFQKRQRQRAEGAPSGEKRITRPPRIVPRFVMLCQQFVL